MKTWQDIQYYAGLDWAKDHHDVVIVNREGTVVKEFRFEHSAAGWSEFRQKIQAYQPLAVVLETNHGMAVDPLLQSDCQVYALNAKQAKHYRDRKQTSDNKTDQVDAWANAEALRTDGAQWLPLQPADPLTEPLRLLCRDEMALIEQRTQLVNQLQQALYEYYPAALEAFEDWTVEATWDFVLQFPTPQALTKAQRRHWEKFLHSHRLWRAETAPKRLAIFARAEQFCGPAAATTAKSLLALSLARLLKTLQAQLKVYRQQIEELFAQHPDQPIFSSLPGVGDVLAPRLLGGLSAHADCKDQPEVLQCLAGTAPVSFQSGQIHRVHVRYQCDKFLRQTMHLWSNSSRLKCPWAQVYYQQKRQEGKSHACALRCLGQRWLKILVKMWQTKTPYDADLHARNQQRHGSWVLQLSPKAA